MEKRVLSLMPLALCLFTSQAVFAKDIPVQGRLFIGSTSADPKNVNESVTPQGIKKIDSASQYGVEVTYPLMKYLNVGARYTKRLINNEEDPADGSTDYSAKVDQDSVLLMARVPFVKSDLMMVDAFAGVGGTNTSLKIKTSGQNGELSRKASEGWFSNPYAAAGASVSVGYKQIFIVLEGGYEMNKVDGFSRTGSINSSVDTLDLSGSYITLGIVLDGVPGSIGK